MKKTLIFLATILCFLSTSAVYSVSVQDELSQKLLRLHIVANSDSEYDQSIKIAIRNEILEHAKAQKNMPGIPEIEEISNTYLKKSGAPYRATARFEHCYVPKKDYKSITLPQGYYNCLKVTLGDGSGENWWCIAYPPLCYTESMFGELSDDSKGELSALLESDTLSAITSTNGVTFRLKIIDVIQKFIHKK